MFEHDYPFDPTHGYDLPRLLAIEPPEPAVGFEAFWRETYARTTAIWPNLTVKPAKLPQRDDIEIYEAYYDSFDGFRCGAWLTLPRHAQPVRGVVMGHGYGSCPAPGELQGPPAVSIHPCGRGLADGLSTRDDLPSVTAAHVVHHLDDREKYIHRGCVADFWAGVSALLAYRPELEGKIDLVGGSFGGGLGALALPWEPRIRRAYLRVPSFGHYPLRVTLPCTGSGHAVSQAVARAPHLLEDVLAYYDAAVAARFIRQPVLVAPALFDPAVPPAGQFAVANAISSQKVVHVLPAGHFTWRGLPEAMRKLDAAVAEWFSQA